MSTILTYKLSGLEYVWIVSVTVSLIEVARISIARQVAGVNLIPNVGTSLKTTAHTTGETEKMNKEGEEEKEEEREEK